jgi:hypothetical protein
MADTDAWLGKISGVVKEANALAKADKEQREAAEKSLKSVIINARDIQGFYDVGRALKTTLGGVNRDLTLEDLKAFQANINTLKENKKLTRHGITARQIIDLGSEKVSGKESDLKRANTQITMSLPVSFVNTKDGGLVRFLTNASKDSKDTRHHVEVEFITFINFVTGAQGDYKQAALKLCREPLKFNCDCGRHRYWFRYVATIGQFNYGRDELGYPKIRNPGLLGVACKHVLRVMETIESSIVVTNFLAKAIEKAVLSGKANFRTTQKEAEEQAAKKRGQIKTSDDRVAANERAKQKRQAEKEKKAAAKAIKETPKPKRPPRKSSTQPALSQDAVNAINSIKKLGLPSEIETSMIAQIMSQSNAK